jgi:flagellar biosynthesis/type III secretory pathway protein FliH
MPDGFVPLDRALRPTPEPPTVSGDLATTVVSTNEAEPDLEDAAAEARRFRAALADALALSLERLVRDVACDVLARELLLAPPDVAAIAARALERYLDDGPLQLRVHPDDRGACDTLDFRVVTDKRLRAGDVVLDVRCGSIDASLGARLETVLG